METFPYMKEFVYGGIDGSVTTFAVVAGATGADMNPGIIIVLGFANLLADGFSMSVGNYLSVKSERRSSMTTVEYGRSPVQTAGATFLSFLVMGFIPLLSYVLSFLDVITISVVFPVSVTLTLASFVFIGYLRSSVTESSRFKSIVETLLLGGIASVLAYYAGSVLEKMLF